MYVSVVLMCSDCVCVCVIVMVMVEIIDCESSLSAHHMPDSKAARGQCVQ